MHKHTHTHQIRETFEKVDVDGNKNLDNEEFGKAFELMGLKLAPNDRDELFKKFDVDGSGTVDLDEFRQMAKTYLGSSEQEQKVIMDGANIEQLCFFFEKFDENGDGEVDLEEFRTMLKISRQAANLFTGSEDLRHLSEKQMEALLLYDDWPARHAGPSDKPENDLGGLFSVVAKDVKGAKGTGPVLIPPPLPSLTPYICLHIHI
jgi:Ca2+-binding EF-hand superfamily protein